MESRFEKCIDEIRHEYKSLQSRADSLHRLVETFNANEEIRKANERTAQVRRLSLCVCTEKEISANNLFCKKHTKSCQSGGKATSFEYIFTRTGIGTEITVRCPVCGEEENITDYPDYGTKDKEATK